MRILLVLCLSGLVMTGLACQQSSMSPTTQKAAVGHCPSCHHEMAAGAYCPACHAIAVDRDEMVRDEACGKTVPAGTWCAKCNAFMFNDMVTVNGRQVRKGTWDAQTKTYAGLKNVTYCDVCLQPVATKSPEQHNKGCSRRDVF